MIHYHSTSILSYIINMLWIWSRENPRSVAESALRSWEDRAARVPALAAGGECQAHMTFPKFMRSVYVSLNYLKGVFRGSLGLRGLRYLLKVNMFLGWSVIKPGLMKTPIVRGVTFRDTVTWAAILTGTGSNLLGKVTCFITRSAGIYAWIYDIFFLGWSIN